MPATIHWIGDEDGRAEFIDQTRLPGELVTRVAETKERIFEAIQRLEIRGAPAIGVAAAFGVVLGMKDARDDGGLDAARRHLDEVAKNLLGARPTAVNLAWALNRMKAAGDAPAESVRALKRRLLAEALHMLDDDRRICTALGENGAPLIADGDQLITHCNAGALATAGSGTALAVMFAAQARGVRFEVFVDETRPLLQGSRLTAWELMRAGIPATVICDNTAAWVMKSKGINRVLVGADRIAANGDVANKIGTYALALAARAHDVPFWVVAPESSFDLSVPSGDAIPIEERSGDEVVHAFGIRTAPEGVRVFAPAFDVTPAALVSGIVTEKGLISPVTARRIAEVLGR